MSGEKFKAISAADFFYKNKEIAGFDNPVRATYTIIRELVENALDACEQYSILPDVRVKLIDEGNSIYRLRVEDNGIGVPYEQVPYAFAQILFGSKYTLRQSRGIFGLGGKMAVLYGQITAHSTVKVTSSQGGYEKYTYELNINIQENKPIIKRKEVMPNPSRWRGTIVQFSFEGDYVRAKPKVVEYFKQTSIILPYATILFIDPDGVIYRFDRITETMPKPAEEVKPHPHGIDLEMVQRMINSTRSSTLVDFLANNFHRVGVATALNFLKSIKFKPDINPKSLTPKELLTLVNKMKEYDGFQPPDAQCLSSVGPELLRAGIMREFRPEFVAVTQRGAAAYGGHPFIVEAAIAYGGEIPITPPDELTVFRYANKIPLLYDLHSDVTMKVIKKINWKRYKLDPATMPLAFFVHICATKVPYKTVGKEYIADRPEVEYEIEWALKTCARQLRMHLAKKEKAAFVQRRLSVFEKYLPMISQFAAELAGSPNPPNHEKVLKRLQTHAKEIEQRSVVQVN
ncbi:MAG: DNA topoisomerase VI subunit B [Candidatus Verstraetearchaeota archaeon]|nr:DNA topoisomerase VI subunit B [Candidatus Verstraetearchaeota archaeon]